jgi:hypothetical protein
MAADEPNPFRFGALALDEAFTDREDELAELVADVRAGQDVVVYAQDPRRPGRPDDDADAREARREARARDP